MASPQLANGHLRIANELYESLLLFPLTKRELLVVLAVIRLTYGYGKKSDSISHYQIAKITGLRRDRIPGTIKELVKYNILIVEDSTKILRGQPIQNIGINKDHESWSTVHKSGTVTVPNSGTVPKTGTVTDSTQNVYGDRTQIGVTTVPKSSHSINNLPKTNKQQETGAHKRGSRLPHNTLPEDWKIWSTENTPRVSPSRTFDTFRDYWIAVPGRKGVKLDWFATWRNWCRREDKPAAPGKQSTASRFMENLKNAVEN
jgi:phage replication O-like protein O